MNILYFLEPNLEMNNPTFRLGSIRNHLSDEISNLKNENQVKIVISDSVYEYVASENLLDKEDCIVIPQKKLTSNIGNSNEVYLKYKENSKKSNYSKEVAFYTKYLSDFTPDCIILYECRAPYLKEIFPNVRIIHNTLGLLSRAPYPELSCYDIEGNFDESFINKNKESIIKHSFPSDDIEFIKQYKDFIKNDILNNGLNSLKNELKRNINILLPLQVSGYFSFDHCCDFKSQIEYIENVAKITPRDIGIIITMHGMQSEIFESEQGKKILNEYDNILLSKEINNTRWSSQNIIPFCDGVFNVSSSVAGLAAIWDLPIYNFGNSQFSIFSEADLKSFFNKVTKKQKVDHTKILTYWLLYYNITTIDTKKSNYLQRLVENSKKYNGLDVYIKTKNNNKAKLYTEYRNTQFALDTHKYTPQHCPGINIDLNLFEKSFDHFDIISFDVFDTLISREIYHPNALFDLMENDVEVKLAKESVSLKDFGGFRNLRERAANRVIRSANKNGYQDITLKDIYNEIGRLLSISSNTELQLRKLEIDYEILVSCSRDFGRKLFNLAKKKNKKIILISDMYLSKNDITLLLKKQGFDLDGIDFFVSSELKKTKKSGDIYDIVKSKHTGEILHIGDNYVADYYRARKSGIDAIHISQASLNFESSYHPKHYINNQLITSGVGTNIYYGLTSRRYFDNNVDKDSFFNGDPKRLGYISGGPILFSFVKWICQRVKEENIDKVCFLARDGYLVKEIYDKFKQYDSKLPDSEYILASRRCFNTASFSTEQDILDSLSMSFSRSTIKFIFEKRYNISSISEKIIKSSGFKSENDIVDLKRGSQRRKFNKLLSLLQDKILQQSSIEKSNLISYFESKDLLNRKEKKAIVDIGHNGTLQRDFYKLTNQKVLGLYFMTFSGAEKLLNDDLKVKGYLANFEDQALSEHPYVKNIGMFEFLFLPPIPSFERFESDENGNLSEVYVSGNENNRFSLIKTIHNEIVNFTNDVLRLTKGNYETFNLSRNHAIKNYIDFVILPTPKDVKMFKDISFVDGFGGSSNRYIINDDPSLIIEENLKKSWWKNGAKVYFGLKEKDLNNIEKTNELKVKLPIEPKRKNKNFLTKKRILKILTKPHVVVKNRIYKHILRHI